jgi:two-component system chemotaxis response regulator CheB
MIRVLVVDDSAFARKVLRQMLSASDVEVIGASRDGLEALEHIATLKPDVVTLDLVMPNLDGVGVLRALPQENAPRVVVVSISHATSDLGVEALQAGAVRLVQKPTALATDQLYELRDELLQAIREAAQARSVSLRAAAKPLPRIEPTAGRRLVVIGTSTGGPQALTRLLAELPRDFPVPLAIALHIPAGYTAELAKRLDTSSRIDVLEASDGLELRPGLAVLAQGGSHLAIERRGINLYARVGEKHSETHAPSVDVLFESAAELGSGALGVVLTGMGSDGLRGARAMHRAGGVLLAEAEASCVVYGMPRVIVEAGIAAAQVRLEDMALAIAERV